MRINRRPSMEKQLVEAGAGTNRDTGDGRRAFRAPINDVFINVYEPISDFVSPWLSSGFQWFKGCGCHSGSAVHPSRFTTSSFTSRNQSLMLLQPQFEVKNITRTEKSEEIPVRRFCLRRQKHAYRNVRAPVDAQSSVIAPGQTTSLGCTSLFLVIT